MIFQRSFCLLASASALLWSGQVDGYQLSSTTAFTRSTSPRHYATTTSTTTLAGSTSPLQSDDDTPASLIAPTNSAQSSRRNLLNTLAASAFSAATAAATIMLAPVEPAFASGGATAGRYTTIPIAKRRYYGRVQEAVHEFLIMGNDVVKSDMTAATIQTFFDIEGAVVVPAKRQDINGACTKKDKTCKGGEIRDSRYNDMKASMYLLANAFRINQQKPPDRLPTVQAAFAFFKEMDQMEKLVKKKPKTNDPAAVGHFAAALDILDRYLDLVELPPIDSGNYDKEFDTLVGKSARIT